MKPIVISSTMLEALIQNMDHDQFDMVAGIVDGERWRRNESFAEGQELSPDEIEMIKRGEFSINVIKSVKTRLNCSLSAANMIVNRNWKKHARPDSPYE